MNLPRSLAILALLLAPSPAAAASVPLIQLAGDAPVTLPGSATYGAVYLDGEVRLTGDTVLTATSVYIGPDATVRTCWVQAAAADTCTAGRSLTIRASGSVWVVGDLALRPATPGPGGALTITGTTIALGGQVDTRGIAAASGPIDLRASVVTTVRELDAAGASVRLDGASVSATGDLNLAGPDTSAGGSLAVRAAGDVALANVDGSGGPGGSGGSVTITGGTVRILRVALDGGASDGAAGGHAGALSVTSSGAVSVASVTAAGGRSARGVGGAAGAITVDALGIVTLGEVAGDGGPGVDGGTAAAVALAGDAVAVERVYASGGAGSGGLGGAGGTLAIEAGGAAAVGAAFLDGGSGASRSGGSGGMLTVTAARAMIGAAYTDGGATTGSVAGVPGGAITIDGRDGVTVSHVESSGGDAGDGAGQPGGAGGAVRLRAGQGAVTAAGSVITSGGRGGAGTPVGGRGGVAGSVDLVGVRAGRIGAVIASGGQGGAGSGEAAAGGDGGRVRWFGPGDLFDGSWVLANAGGDGAPHGLEGSSDDHGSPKLVLAAGRITATASGVAAGPLVVVESDAFGPWRVVGPLPAAGIALPKGIACLGARLAVAESSSASPSWLGPASDVVAIPASRSTRGCDRAPRIAVTTAKATARQLRRALWSASLTLRSAGSAVVTRIYVSSDDDRTLIRVVLPVGPGTLTGVPITLPPWARHAGTYRIELAVRAPFGVSSRVAVARLVVR